MRSWNLHSQIGECQGENVIEDDSGDSEICLWESKDSWEPNRRDWELIIWISIDRRKNIVHIEFCSIITNWSWIWLCSSSLAFKSLYSSSKYYYALINASHLVRNCSIQISRTSWYVMQFYANNSIQSHSSSNRLYINAIWSKILKCKKTMSKRERIGPYSRARGYVVVLRKSMLEKISRSMLSLMHAFIN